MPTASSFAIDVPASLLARARAGERAAFEQLYRRFERPVFNLALRMCGDRDEASDVLQDTMLKLFDRIGDFRGVDGAPFWGWLRRVAVTETVVLTALGAVTSVVLLLAGRELLAWWRPAFPVVLTPGTLAQTAAAAVVMALLAAWLPTRRLAQMDAASAFRSTR